MTDLIRDLENAVRIVQRAGLDIRHLQVMDGFMVVTDSAGREYVLGLRECRAVVNTSCEKLDKGTLREMLETIELLERVCLE